MPRFLRYLARNAKPSPYYNQSSTLAEWEIIWNCFFYHPELVHVTYVENLLGILPEWKERLAHKIIGTVHQPASWWRLVHPNPDIVSSLDAIIVLARQEISYFEQYLPGRVYFIPHGVDIDFFRPAVDSQRVKQAPRCIFSGKHLRDLQALAAVIETVLRQNPRIGFDIILPSDRRTSTDPYLMRMARHEQVCWHANLSDGQLRQLYQQASLLALPLLDSTTNNALLEAIACGLPVVSNDVGGMRDYTAENFADLFPIGDVDGLSQAILKLVGDPETWKQRSLCARKFAEENLSWTRIAQMTGELYTKVLQEG
jgi:glycosyltransferase involved in cell wall biosynthesis